MEAAKGQVDKESWSLAKDSGIGLQSESKHSVGRFRCVRTVGRDMPRIVASNEQTKIGVDKGGGEREEILKLCC